MLPLTDPIGDLLTRMRNAQHARKTDTLAPLSRMKLQLCELLKKEGWIADVEIVGDAPKQNLKITFVEDKPNLTLERISKPGRRVYQSADEIKPVLHGYGIAIITTSNGLLTDAQAREKGVGGEVLCTIA